MSSVTSTQGIASRNATPGTGTNTLALAPAHVPLLRVASEPLQSRLNDVLRDTTAEVVSTLFRNEAVVKLVLSGLPSSARLLLSRLMPLTQASPYQPLLAWYAGNHSLLRATLMALRRVKVVALQQLVQPSPASGTPASVGAPSDAGGSSTSGTALQNGSPHAPPKHLVHREFRNTYISLVTKKPRTTDRFSSIEQVSTRDKDSLESPDGCALQTCAQKNWSNLLGFLFCTNVKLPTAAGNPVEKNITPPGPALLEVLNLKQLIYVPETAIGAYRPPADKQRPKIPRAAFHWLLSDLSEQLSALLFAFIDGVSLGLIKASGETSSPLIAAAKCLALLCEIAVVKFGEPLPLKHEISPTEEKFVSLCHELGIIVTGTSFLSGKSFKVMYPTPLIRIMVLSRDESAGGDAWTLSQMFGIQTYQDWLVLNSNVRRFALPKSRYSPQCLARSVGILEVSNTENFEFDFSRPADLLKDCTLGYVGQQPSLSTITNRSNVSLGPSRGIIVESNFRVFSYRPDQLQISVLFNLCEVKVMSPTLMVGILTRDSVMNAFSDGLTAKQIIRFFASHAHPSVKKRITGRAITKEKDSTSSILSSSHIPSALPENVSSQLELWEAQRSSVSLTDACLFEFTEEAELSIFPQLVARAKLNNSLLAHTPFPSNALTTPKGTEFVQWKAQVLQRLKTRSTIAAFGENHNWFAAGAIIVVKLETKGEMSRNITQARVGQNLLPPRQSEPRRTAGTVR